MRGHQLVYCAFLIGIFGGREGGAARLAGFMAKICARAFQSCSPENIVLRWTGRVGSGRAGGASCGLADPYPIHLR